ncbi:MAG: hypothetical protein WDM86_03200 [Rhizomicrobium sp.]
MRLGAGMPVTRHRILEHRGPSGDGWMRQFALTGGDVEAFVRYIAMDHGHNYKPALAPRGPQSVSLI